MDNTPAPPSSQVRLYRHQPLDVTEEIRLIKILLGQFEDKLQIEIHHTPLQVPERSSSQRLRIDELRETLPEIWQIFETIENDYLFWNNNTEDTSWDHPNPEIGHVLYAPLPQYPDGPK